MASSTMTSTIFLRGAPDAGEDVRVQSSWSKRPAILVNLNEHVLLQLQQCCQQGKVVQFLGGVAPKLRYGSKTLNLNVRPETFRHEIYEANKARTGSLDFSTLVSYEAHVKPTEQKSESSAAGADAALAALKESLASMAQQKEARKVTISNSVIPNTKNGSLQSHRHSSSLLQRPSFNSSSSTPRSVAAPTSAPQTDSQNAAVEKGMRTALIHLLATAPTTERELHSKTRVPTPQLSSILPKIAEKTGSQWELSSKSFKELDPWTFRYPSEKQRQAAIDNAIRAFDRIRVPKDDRLWQTLLPKEDRGTGKVLSRLHLGVERREQTGTPALSPLPAQNTMEGTETETATPKLGPASTRRNGAVATGRSAAGISIEKRLREATKKQVQDKKKKDKDKEAVTSDRESKPRVTKPRPTVTKRVVAPKRVSEKIKSAELVHDSDEDEEGEITDSKPARKHETPLADSHRLGTRPKTSTMPGKGGLDPKRTVSAQQGTKAPAAVIKRVADDSTPSQREKKIESGATVKRNGTSGGSAATSVKAKPGAAASKSASEEQPGKGSNSSSSSSERQSSPKKDTKPKVPSPLGTWKPRTASEETDKTNKPGPPAKAAKAPASSSVSAKSDSMKKARADLFGGATGRQAPVIKKRTLEYADGDTPRKAVKPNNTSNTTNSKATTGNSTKPASKTSPAARSGPELKGKRPPASSTPAVDRTDAKLKRKANDMSSDMHNHDVPLSKHRKTDSSSTHSLDPTSSSLTSLTTAPTASPGSASPTSPAQRASPSSQDTSNATEVIQMFLNDSEASPKTQSTWEAALDKAAKFRTQLYPAYLELYDRLENMAPEDVAEEDRRRLFMMHSKLKAFKKNIYDAVG